MSVELNNGALAIKKSLMNAHEFFAKNKEYIDFQIVNVKDAFIQNYLGGYGCICITLRSKPGKHSIRVRDGSRFPKETILNPYLPFVYFCIHLPLRVFPTRVSIDKIENRTSHLPYVLIHPLLVDSNGEILEPFWPTYDTRYGVHNCGVQQPIPPRPANLVQEDFYQIYLMNIWDGFWNSTFTYNDMTVSRRAGEVARVIKSVGQNPNRHDKEFCTFDISGILAAADHHRIPWSKYPKMSAQDVQRLINGQCGAGLNFKLNTRSWRYKQVKDQINGLTLTW